MSTLVCNTVVVVKCGLLHDLADGLLRYENNDILIM